MNDTTRDSISSLHFPNGYERIDEIISGYKRNQILTSALHIGLFDFLETNKSAKREEINSSLPLCGMLSRSYLNALVSMGFLSGKDEIYSNTAISTDFLVKKSPYYQGDLIIGNSSTGSRWDILHEAMISNDGTVPGNGPGPNHQFLRSMAQRTIQGEAQEIINWISSLPQFSSKRKLLDIGGGHGLFSIGLCQINPDLQAVILDQPHVIDLSQSFIHEYAMEKQISVKAGDIQTEQYTPEYDLIVISHLLYKFRNNLDEIFRLVTQGLKRDGILVLNHWFCSPGCTASSDPIRELERSLQSAGHPLCHLEVFEALFSKYGLKCIKTGSISTPFGESSIHAAEKQ